MKEFLFIYRRDASVQLSPEQMQAMMKPWRDWMGSVAAQNKLVNEGNRLTPEGAIVKPNNVVTNGPYVELKELVSGYSIVKANDLAEATRQPFARRSNGYADFFLAVFVPVFNFIFVSLTAIEGSVFSFFLRYASRAFR